MSRSRASVRAPEPVSSTLSGTSSFQPRTTRSRKSATGSSNPESTGRTRNLPTAISPAKTRTRARTQHIDDEAADTDALPAETPSKTRPRTRSRARAAAAANDSPSFVALKEGSTLEVASPIRSRAIFDVQSPHPSLRSRVGARAEACTSTATMLPRPHSESPSLLSSLSAAALKVGSAFGLTSPSSSRPASSFTESRMTSLDASASEESSANVPMLPLRARSQQLREPTATEAAHVAPARQPRRRLGLLRSLRGDWMSVMTLLLLYILQGVPMGLSMTIPLILQERTAAANAAAASAAEAAATAAAEGKAPIDAGSTAPSIESSAAAAAAAAAAAEGAAIPPVPHAPAPAGDAGASAKAGAGSATHAAPHGSGDYAAQAIFSLVSLPFSLKLLWAPLVDALYLPWAGRRKTWVVPVQLLCATVLVWGASDVDRWLGSSSGTGSSAIDVPALTIYFLLLYTLMATQDIAVDGWALTMLRRRNTPLAATVNAIGQSLGAHATHLGYLVLASPEACDGYLRPFAAAIARALPTGLLGWLSDFAAGSGGAMSLPTFIRMTGWAYAIVTVAVAIFQREWDTHPLDAAAAMRRKARAMGVPSASALVAASDAVTFAGADPHSSDDEEGAGDHDQAAEEEGPSTVSETVSALVGCLKLPSVRLTVLFLVLASRTGSAPGESVAALRLLDAGVSKATIAAVSAAAAPVGMLVPLLATGLATSSRAWKVSLLTIIPRIAMSLAAAGLVAGVAAATGSGATEGPWWVYPSLLALAVGQATSSSVQMLCGMGLFARVADPAIGGTFMTLLNTAGNLSAAWTRAAALKLVKPLTVAHCVLPTSSIAAQTSAAQAAATAGISATGGWRAAVAASYGSTVAGVFRAAGSSSAARSVGLFPQCEAALLSDAGAVKAAAAGRAACAAVGGTCETLLDGFTVETVLFAAAGLALLWLFWPYVRSLDTLPLSAWRAAPSAASAPPNKVMDAHRHGEWSTASSGMSGGDSDNESEAATGDRLLGRAARGRRKGVANAA